MDRAVDYLEPVAHAALIGVAVTLAWLYWPSASPAPPQPSIHIDSSRVLQTWHPDKQRVFLFLSPTCSYCNKGMDFYARVGETVDSLQRRGAPVALAAVIGGADSPRAQRRVLRNSGVTVDTLLTLSSRSLRPVGVTGVPTVVVEGSGEGAPSTWTGLQDSTGAQEILSAVRSLEEAP